MAVQTITYTNKADLYTDSSIADINKVKASDMNQIKSVVNNNATELTHKPNIQTSYNTSTTDTYSCNYANEVYGGILLWTNSNPTSDFAAQTVPISLSNYKFVRIYYKSAKNENELYAYDGIVGYDGKLNRFWASGYGYLNIVSRYVSISTSGITIDGCLMVRDGSYSSGNNDRIIPMYIIGYKSNVIS